MKVNNKLFWKLLEPLHPGAEAFCRRLCGNSDDGDDLYQDSLLQALHKFESLRDHQAFKSWLFRMIVNRFKNRRRDARWRRQVPLTQELIESAGGPDPRTRLDSVRLLAYALAALKPEDRALITLFEIEGWQVDELARIFKRPTGTVKARLFRARQKMREHLEKLLTRQEKKQTRSEVGYALQRSHTTNK